MPRTLNATFDDDDFQRLKQLKGDRSWEDAILEEFGVDSEEDPDEQ